MAIGAAKILGIDLTRNFFSPYFATSIKGFWSKWHISLSTWFRDYLYIPLGGNRVGALRKHVNVMITFLASGLWHGASWNFVIWGAIHGICQVCENSVGRLYKTKGTKQSKDSVQQGNIICTLFLWLGTQATVLFAWVFFRANSLEDALYVISNAFIGIENTLQYVYGGYEFLGLSKIMIILFSLPTLLLFVFDYYSLKLNVIEAISKKRRGSDGESIIF